MNTLHPLAAALAMLTAVAIAIPPVSAQPSTPAAASERAASQQSYASPQDAVAALIAALRAEDRSALLSVVGPSARSWLFSGDPVADARDWKQFVAAHDARHALALDPGGRKAVLSVGSSEFPFAAPIVQRGQRWVFDTAAGREETLNRRVGRNELDTIQTLLAVVDAQREYALSDADGNGLHDYAAQFISQPGKKNGLYWSAPAGQPSSPLGPRVAAAMKDGYSVKGRDLKPSPYNGYLFRMLSGQGRHATGGKYDYRVKGTMFGGFAVLAYPAKYGISGVMTFIVNHDGVVYEKDLGRTTSEAAERLTRFDPDASWKRLD